MKISIPSFLTSTFVLSLLSTSIYLMCETFMSKFIPELGNLKSLGLLFFYSIVPIILVFLIKKFKIIKLSEESINVIYPFRFKKIEYRFSEVLKIDWEIYSSYRSSDYLRMKIFFKGGRHIDFTNVEYENFGGLEDFILNNVKCKRSISKKNKLRLEQAKTNRFDCALYLVFLSFCLYVIFISLIKQQSVLKYSILFLLLLAILRLVKHLIKYVNIVRKEKKNDA